MTLLPDWSRYMTLLRDLSRDHRQIAVIIVLCKPLFNQSEGRILVGGMTILFVCSQRCSVIQNHSRGDVLQSRHQWRIPKMAAV